jgi:hypothetical protein
LIHDSVSRLRGLDVIIAAARLLHAR